MSEQQPILVMVGGVGELFQGDLDLGRVAVERLAAEGLGDHVVVEDLHYGAVAVAQRLQELKPSHLVLVGGVVRGRPPASVERRRPAPAAMSPAEFQLAVGDAVVGYVSIDLVVEVGAGLGVLPARTVAIEMEPVLVGPSDRLSPEGDAAVDEILALVRAEVRRAPLVELAERIAAHGVPADHSPAAATLVELVAAVLELGDGGRFGRVWVLRDRLRRQIDAGETGESMDALDWALWWALLEELDKVLAAEL
ncbi:MAG TPA: hypothetical protein VFJ85_17625 [Acidimicrobiales bacterium]|nr:hypothetical protein [Acidimicrobiales bacterium]